MAAAEAREGELQAAAEAAREKAAALQGRLEGEAATLAAMAQLRETDAQLQRCAPRSPPNCRNHSGARGASLLHRLDRPLRHPSLYRCWLATGGQGCRGQGITLPLCALLSCG